ncbi:SusD/RagB family nutrient-binding outer membrane lipoprotein [Tenacibaculum sp. C7A-26P2]|uniref:SusD/RagB family nutrient-binding outer membrane lipoprotein n=1 Tax=Tenacibaculum sp. C7A-26P2 TaxID=3447504 RepID=UPI003F846490
MKKIKYTLLGFAFMTLFHACDTDYIDNPDQPVVATSNSLLTNAQFDLAYELNDQWTGGRGFLGFSQYWAQTFYTDENRYALRTSQIESFWEWPYRILTDLKEIINLNSNPETAPNMAILGNNNNQIQVARIMMAFTFTKLVDTFGDVPYWSFGQKDNPSFQALRLKEGITSPVYTDAKIIYQDILAELLDAANKMDLSKRVFFEDYEKSDNIYKGDPTLWSKFAHSLRLRLASHIIKSDQALANSVFNESDNKAFTSNMDNATFKFGGNDLTGGPWHVAFNVNKREDFAPALPFTELLYNNVGPFATLTDKDPRVDHYFDKAKETTEVIGVPYGFGNSAARAVKNEGRPHEQIIKADYNQPLLTYSEIEFIRSEFKSWDQNHYVNGIKASMEFWGIASSDATTYISSLPSSSEENVLTQKYIALYMDGLEAWTEYRKSAFPKTLVVPGDTFNGDTFEPIVPGLNKIPSRITYPQKEQLINRTNWDEARKKLSDGDTMNSNIFWDIN